MTDGQEGTSCGTAPIRVRSSWCGKSFAPNCENRRVQRAVLHAAETILANLRAVNRWHARYRAYARVGGGSMIKAMAASGQLTFGASTWATEKRAVRKCSLNSRRGQRSLPNSWQNDFGAR